MKRIYFACLFLCLTTTFLLSQSNPVPLVDQSAIVASPISASQTDPKAQAKILDSYGKLPLSFEANHGQADGRVKFLSRTSGYSLFLTGDEAVLALSGTKIHTGSALVYSTYLGGSGGGGGSAIAVDSAGNAYVTGGAGAGFPVTPGAFQTTFRGYWSDAFVAKLNPAGSALVYSTYLGGTSDDFGTAIAVDTAGNAYVIGYTYSHNFPTKNNLQAAKGFIDAFVAKIDVRPATTTTLSSSPNPSTYGQAVTFTAVVTSGAGAPPDGETVAFMKGTTSLGTGALSGGSGSFTTSTLLVGTNLINAVYGGDSNFADSKSKTTKQVVKKATTTTALASSQNPSNSGQSVTFTASVAPEFSGKVTLQ